MAAAMNGDGESCSDAVADVPKDLRSMQGCVSKEGHSFSAQEPTVSAEESVSIISYNQISVLDVLKVKIGGTSPNEGVATTLEVPLVPVDRMPEDISLAADVNKEVAIGLGDDVESEKLHVSDGWNNGMPNGTSGWASAEPPGDESGVVPAPAGTGVLGLGLAGAVPAAEQPVQQLYTYYMIRIPRPVDDKARADIMDAEAKLQAKADERDQHNVHVQTAKRKRNEAFEKRQAAREVERDWLKKLKAKLEELKPLRDGLKKIRETWTRDKSEGVPSSEADLDSRIAGLEWRIQHESISLKEEKQLMRDIKALESSRESVRQTAARNVQVQETVGSREDLEEALKPLNAEYKQLEVEFKAASAKRVAAEEEFEKLNEALTGVMGQLHKANGVRQEAYEARRLLKQQEYGRLKDFYDNKREIQQAKDMASQPKSRKVVEEYCGAQVERVMELWSTNDGFRKTYVKDNERSTVRRLETLDGRVLGPDEKPPKVSSSDCPTLSNVSERSQSKPSVTVTTQSIHQDGIEVEEEVNAPVTKERSKAVPNVEILPVVELSSSEVEQEAAELKEKRRAAEMAKAKEAEERKKRTTTRAQLKALARAQKEAEKKEKDREKRALKKSAVASSAEALSVVEPSIGVESSESNPEVEEAVVETKVSFNQRKRGVTSAQKALKGAEKIPSPTARRGRRKVLGLPVFSLMGLGALAVVLVAIAIFMINSGNSERRSEGRKMN